MLNLALPYIEAVAGSNLFDNINGNNVGVVIDPMGGTGSKPLSFLLLRAGFSVRLINDTKEIRPGDQHPYPHADNLTDLESTVNGRFINWNMLFPLFVDYLNQAGMWQGDIACTHTTTRAIDLVAQRYGIKVHRTPVGFRHVSRLMREQNCFGGFEGNGGAVIQFIGLDKDGILMNLLMARILSERIAQKDPFLWFGAATDGDADRFAIVDTEQASIMGLVQQTLHSHGISPDFGFMQETFISLNDHPTLEGRIAQVNADSAQLFRGRGGIAQIEELEDGRGTKVITLNDDSWLLARLSGTEHGGRIYVESPTRARRDELISFVRSFLIS